MNMMNWIVAVLTATQVVQGMVPDIGATEASDAVSVNPTRSLMGRRELTACSPMWGQCGGMKWTGPKCCSVGSCQVKHEWYSQCLTGGGGGGAKTTTSITSSQNSATKEQVQTESGGSDGGSGGGGGSAGSCGEFAICISGSSETFGPTVAQREWPKQGSAVTITSSGSCSWEEYAGGFDGYPSPAIDDGHEKGMDMAIKQMFPGDRTKQTAFLVSMIDIAKPIDMDFPEDEARANNGERMNNIRKLNSACSQLVSVCCN